MDENTYTIRVIKEYQFRAPTVDEARAKAAMRVTDERALQWFDIQTV